MLCGMALLMLASFSAVAWQIVAAVYVPPPAALTCAAGALGGECAAAL